MNTANPSKNNIMFNIVFLFLCVFMFIWAALALFGVVPGDVHSLVVLLTPALLGAGFLSRLWPVWRGKQIPISLAAVLSLAAGGLAFLLWQLSGQPFARYDLVYLILLPVPFVMGGVLRFNQTPSQSNGNNGPHAS